MIKRNNAALFRVVFALIAIAVLVVAFLIVRDSRDFPPENKSEAVTSPSANSGESGMRLESTNVERKNDASKVAGAVNEFMNNNSGDAPTSWSAGKLMGEAGSIPAAFTLTAYTALVVTGGSQPAVTDNTLRLVMGAACAADGSAKASTSKRDYAVQYGRGLAGSATFESKCVGN